MLLKLAEYEHNVHLRRPGAQQALQDFKNQQNEMVAAIREVSSIFILPYHGGIILKTHAIPIQSKREREQWCDKFAMGRYNDKQAVIDQRFES